ncbi:MAG TPA: serine/threonine-protein kinase [Rubricoccaceae bacterium]|jgi:serine/threonine-protein kinase
MTPLPPDRWPEVEALFAAATEHADAEALLAATEPALAAEVRALLAADRTASDAVLADFGTLLVDASLDLIAGLDRGPDRDGGLAPGTRVGPWMVEDEIGAGGMGVVYRARRADGIHEQAVALKVVRRGMDSVAVVRRFVQERAVLAGLDHPGIARLLDGGTAPDGRPYLVLDLVDGVPVTEWADGCRASVEARVAVFIQVCEAVAHAHRRLVVHRDLKPSNILVADADEAGAAPRVTLLDFGVAHLLDAPADALTITGDGPRPMTPGYAAPEQLAGAPVTTATDVYALGVILYELLTGCRPPARLAGPALRAAPSRPSTAMEPPRRTGTRAGGTGTGTGADRDSRDAVALAAARDLTPDRLQRRLRGDLDAIVMKALRPEPEARYASVDALADDLRRHLGGLPVAARDGSARYVAGRFVRRHRWSVAASLLAMALLAGGVAVVTAQNRRVVRERDKAEEIASVLETLFLDVDPGGPNGAPATLHDVLDAGAARVQALSDTPDAQAHLLDVLARVYRALADYDRALPLHRAAVQAATRAHGPAAPETLLARHHLAYLLDQMGRGAEAERIYRDVLAARRRSDDPDGLVESYSDLSAFVLRLGRPAEAAALAHDGLAVLERYPYAGPPDLEGPLSRASFLTVLAQTDEADGRPDAAEGRLREAVAIYARTRGPEHTYTAAAETSLGALLARRGRHAEADRLLRHAVGVQTRTWGPAHPWTTGALMARAAARARAGDASAARALLADVRARVGSDSARVADLDQSEHRIDSLSAGSARRSSVPARAGNG